MRNETHRFEIGGRVYEIVPSYLEVWKGEPFKSDLEYDDYLFIVRHEDEIPCFFIHTVIMAFMGFRDRPKHVVVHLGWAYGKLLISECSRSYQGIAVEDARGWLKLVRRVA